MLSTSVTLPKSPEEDLLITGKHSLLIPNSFSMCSDHSSDTKSISIVRLALLESVIILVLLVSLYSVYLIKYLHKLAKCR